MTRRTRGREIALQVLYQTEQNPGLAPQEIRRFVDRRLRGDKKLCEFAEALIAGVHANQPRIDELISTVAENWRLDRMAAIDRNILRLGAFELLYCTDVPTKVAINESLELAKRYSTAQSSRFVNGILDRLQAAERRLPIGSSTRSRRVWSKHRIPWGPPLPGAGVRGHPHGIAGRPEAERGVRSREGQSPSDRRNAFGCRGSKGRLNVAWQPTLVLIAGLLAAVGAEDVETESKKNSKGPGSSSRRRVTARPLPRTRSRDARFDSSSRTTGSSRVWGRSPSRSARSSSTLRKSRGGTTESTTTAAPGGGSIAWRGTV